MIASSTPASANSGTTSGRPGVGTGGSWSGGIDRAGAVTLGSVGATCFVGSGEGIGVARRDLPADFFRVRRRPWVLRAGLVVRERVTLDLRCFFAATAGFFLFETARLRVVERAFAFAFVVWVFRVFRLVVFFFTAFLERDVFALERVAAALEREVALERVLLAA